MDLQKSRSWLGGLLTGAIVVSACGFILRAEDKPAMPNMEDMMKQMAVLQAPGEQHKALAQYAGQWKLDMSMRMAADAPEQTSTGESKLTSVLDGRYLMEETKSSMMGQPYQGIAMLGYDNTKKAYVSTWFDSMSTGPMVSYGTPDASGKVITYNSEFDCPMQPGTKMKMKIVWTLESNDAFHLDFYEDMGQGEFKSMTLKYTRTK